jgi:hypothetical protein
LTGGGTLAADITFNVGAGAGITVAADTVAVDLSANFSWSGSHTFGGALYSGTILPSLADVYDLGSYSAPWRKIWGSELSAVVFSQHEQVLLGGWLTISKGEGKLTNAVTAANTQIDLGAGTFVNGDILVFRGISTNGTPQVEYMGVGTLVSHTTYNVTRNLDGTGANDWPEGTVYANWGKSGNGRLELNAEDSPRFSVYSHGDTIAANKEQIRIGDLNGNWGYASSVYGAAFGEYTTGKPNLLIEPDKLELRNYDQTIIKLTGTSASFENIITLGSNGGIRQGSGTWGTNFTGTALWNDSGVMNIGGWNNNIKQWWGSSDGRLYVGSGFLSFGADGILFEDTVGYGSKVAWEGYAVGEPYAVIEDFTISGLPNFFRGIHYLLSAPYATNRDDTIRFGIMPGGALYGSNFQGLEVVRPRTVNAVTMYYQASGGHVFNGPISGTGVSTTSAANKLVKADAAGKIDNGWLSSTVNADTVDGYHASSFMQSLTWGSWTPTQVGWTALPTGTYRYAVLGKIVFWSIDITAGTSNSNQATLTAPVAIARTTGGVNALAINNGTLLTIASKWYANTNGSTLEFATDMGAGGWVTSGTKRVRASGFYEIS